MRERFSSIYCGFGRKESTTSIPNPPPHNHQKINEQFSFGEVLVSGFLLQTRLSTNGRERPLSGLGRSYGQLSSGVEQELFHTPKIGSII